MGKTAGMGINPTLRLRPAAKWPFRRLDRRRLPAANVYFGPIIGWPFTSSVARRKRIAINQRVADGQKRVGGGRHQSFKITPFDEWARAFFFHDHAQRGKSTSSGNYGNPRPRIPRWKRLASGVGYTWDMRGRTSSIPAGHAQRGHSQEPRPDEARPAAQDLCGCTFQSERSRREPNSKNGEGLSRPDEVPKQIKLMHQANATRILREIAQRREVGQHELAFRMLSTFPGDGSPRNAPSSPR